MARRIVSTVGEAMEGITPMTNVNGTPVVRFDEQRDAAVEILSGNVDIGARKTNPDGSIARSRVVNAAINEDVFYDNRYRLKDDAIEILCSHTTDGYRVLKSVKDNGRAPFRHINVAVVKRMNGKLQLAGHAVVNDDEFINDFTHKLDKESMKELLPVIYFTPEVTGEDKLPI